MSPPFDCATGRVDADSLLELGAWGSAQASNLQ